MKTIIDSIIDQKILNAFQILEVIRESNTTPQVKVICLYCETEQIKPYTALYQYYIGDRRRISCVEPSCNSYRKSDKSLTYIEYKTALERGCRACGKKVRDPGQLCKRCLLIVNKVGGERSFARYVRKVIEHTEDFTIDWEPEVSNG